MNERERLEGELKNVEEAIDSFAPVHQQAVRSLTEALSGRDLDRINSARDQVEIATTAAKSLLEAQQNLQRRLEFLSNVELTRASIRVATSQKKATWTTLVIAVIAMLVSAGATIVAALLG